MGYMLNVDEDGNFETSDEHMARLQFAVHLFDGYSRTAGSRGAAVHAACRKARVSRDAFELTLARHKWTQRALRNHSFIKLRASGWSITWIAEFYRVNPNTVRAAIRDFRERLTACDKQRRKRVRVSGKDGWEGKT